MRSRVTYDSMLWEFLLEEKEQEAGSQKPCQGVAFESNQELGEKLS